MPRLKRISMLLFFANLCSYSACIADTQTGHTEEPAKPAKQSSEVHYYKLDFLLTETGEHFRTIATRRYEMVVASDNEYRPQSIRAGNKVPVPLGGAGFKYEDVGVRIDCSRINEVGPELSMRIASSISGIMFPEKEEEATTNGVPAAAGPLERSDVSDSFALLPIGKSTQIFRFYDAYGAGSIQLNVTVTTVQP